MSGAPGSRTLEQWEALPPEEKVWDRFVELSNRNRRTLFLNGRAPPRPPAPKVSLVIPKGEFATGADEALDTWIHYKLYEEQPSGSLKEYLKMKLMAEFPFLKQKYGTAKSVNYFKINSTAQLKAEARMARASRNFFQERMRDARPVEEARGAGASPGGAGASPGGAGSSPAAPPSRGGSPVGFGAGGNRNPFLQATRWQDALRAAEIVRERREAEAGAGAAAGGGEGGGGGLLGILGSLVGRRSPQPAAAAPAAPLESAAAAALAPAPSNTNYQHQLVGGSRKTGKKSRIQRKSTRRSKKSRKSTRRH